jgi:predicted RNA-binding Zn-ribbon protein involved in translation (DUF1610 family)
MPSESRTFIELSDISGVEFECPKCQAKILYPIKRHYEPLPENCPSCGQKWFDHNPALPEGQSQVVELVQKTLISLHNITETPAIRAHVRLNIKDLSATTENTERKTGNNAEPTSENKGSSANDNEENNRPTVKSGNGKLSDKVPRAS